MCVNEKPPQSLASPGKIRAPPAAAFTGAAGLNVNRVRPGMGAKCSTAQPVL